MSPETQEKLDNLANSRNLNPSQVVRQAITTEEFLRKEVANGGRILIEKEDGSLRELVLQG